MNSPHTTSLSWSPTNAYNYNPNNGNINNNTKTNNNYARCVRFEKENALSLFSFENIFNSYIDCRKSKRSTINALRFEENLEANLRELYSALNNKTYELRRSVCFTVLEPKPREIFAADFRDRIIHHLIVNALEKLFEQCFIDESFACRKNKGTHKAVRCLQHFTRQLSSDHVGKKKTYFLQLDISNFFMSIDKQILFSIVEEKIKQNDLWNETFKQDLAWICKKAIFHDPASNFFQKSPEWIRESVPKHKSLIFVEKGKGLPIGNQTSQFFANVYLNELDYFVKSVLGCNHYVRYVDDFILMSNNKDELMDWFWDIRDFLQEKLLLRLNPKVTLLPLNNGIDFLGYIVRPWSIYIRRRVLVNFKHRLVLADSKLLEKKTFFFEKNSTERKHFQATFASYCGHFKHADSFRLKQGIMTEFAFTKLCFCAKKPDSLRCKLALSKKEQNFFIFRKTSSSIG